MSADKPDDTRSHETDFAAMWSSDGVTRSIGPTATGLPTDLPFLFSSGQQFGPKDAVEESSAVARAFPVMNRVRGEHELAARAIANHPQRSPAEVKKADEVVAKLMADQEKGLAALQTPRALWAVAVSVAAFASAFVGVLALLGSLAARGGVTFRAFGTALVREDGSHAGRIRAFLRALMSWFPVAVLCTLVVLGPGPNRADLTLTLLTTAVLLLFIGCAVWAMLHPSRGIQDRFASTWIVPR